jgi:hypothetical protein
MQDRVAGGQDVAETSPPGHAVSGIRKEGTVDFDFEKVVDRGADVLDKINPGWELKIDPANLSLESGCMCVLGQLYGSYSLGCDEVERWGLLRGDSSDLGFCVDAAHRSDWDDRKARAINIDTDVEIQGWEAVELEEEEFWRTLTDTWIHKIKGRLDAGVQV